MGGTSYETQEVFVPVGPPDLTFIKRDAIERAIKAWEINKHKHLLIFGPSKTGKTSLWKRYIPQSKVIKIACNAATTINQAYKTILEEVGASIIESQTIESSKKTNVLGEIGALLPFITGKLSKSKEVAGGTSADRKFIIANLDAQKVIKFLKQTSKIIIVEDFHYTGSEFRQQLSQDLKAFSDEKCPWIIVGVQHKTSNLLGFNVDLSQRIAEIPVENFTHYELEQIIGLGELALNIDLSEIKDLIIAEANGSASLVQNICQRICLIKNIYNTCDSKMIIDGVDIFKTACEEIAKENKSFYEKAVSEIAKGGRSDGSTQKYKWFIRMIQEREIPENGIKNTEVYHILQEMGHGGIDQSSVTGGLKYLPKLLQKNNLPALIDYNESNKHLYLLDTYMKFVFKWIPGIVENVFEE